MRPVLKRVMLRIPLLNLILRGGVPSFYHLLGALVVVGLGIGLIAPSEQKAYPASPISPKGGSGTASISLSLLLHDVLTSCRRRFANSTPSRSPQTLPYL